MSLHRYLPTLTESAEYVRMRDTLRRDRAPVWVQGLAGVAKTLTAAALAEDVGQVVLFVTASEDAAERMVLDLPAFGIAPSEVGLYPASNADLDELLPTERVLASSATQELRALARSRLAVLEALADG